MEVSRIVLQILCGSSREEDSKTCELYITCPIVDKTQVPESAPCMLTVDCIRSGALADWKISGLVLSQRSIAFGQASTLSTCTYKGSSTPSEAVASLAYPVIQMLDSV